MNELKKRIMRKIYAIWFIKVIAPVLFLQMPLLVLIAFRETAREFFVAKIVENFLVALHNSGLAGLLGFISSAVGNTPVLPVVIIIFSLAIFSFLTCRLARNIRELTLVRSY